MGLERKCILCLIVYNSKQEMDEHMRSMLHHRELENLKGRDCDHECRVCRVTVVGLTAYASHISSQLHKDKVEAQEREDAGKGDTAEHYFDKDLIELIEKRKERIRKEDASADNSNQGDCRRRSEERQNFPESQSRRHHKGAPPRDWEGNGFQNNGQRNFPHPSRNQPHHSSGTRGASSCQSGSSGWHPSQGQASWHQSWQGRNWHHDGRGGFPAWKSGSRGKWSFTGFPPSRDYLQDRFHWGRHNGKQGSSQDSYMDFTSDSLLFSNAIDFSQAQTQPVSKTDRNNEKSSSNPPKDKTHRWAPYPPAKSQEVGSKNDDSRPTEGKDPSQLPCQPLPLKNLNMHIHFRPDPSPAGEQGERSNSVPLVSSHSVREIKNKPHLKAYLRNRSRRMRRRTQSSPVETLPDQMAPSSKPEDKKSLLKASEDKPKWSAQETNKNSYTCKLRSAKQQDYSLEEMLIKAKEALKCSKPETKTSDQAMETEPFRLERRPSKECKTSTDRTGNRSKMSLLKDISDGDLSDSGRHNTEAHPGNAGLSHPGNSSLSYNETPEVYHQCTSDSETKVLSPSHLPSLQSVDVSTLSSDCQITGDAAQGAGERHVDSGGEGGEHSTQGEDSRASDGELMRGQPAAGSLVTDLSKLGLPASLKRDLTRHITSKSKTGSHEPNLNIARRIRDISGSRKNDSDKESGLKPTLRQLISSSGSCRNVDWDQVYQQVSRKKQEQGKGMPRFGIEMVAPTQNEQEGLDVEEASDMPYLEGYQWESICAALPTSTRKRSLSESSVVNDRSASVYSLFSDNPAGGSREEGARIPALPSPHGPNGDQCSRPAESERESLSKKTSSPSLQELPCVKREVEGTEGEAPGGPEGLSEGAAATAMGPDGSLEGDSSCTSGAEQNDSQGVGKKRRAAAEGHLSGVPSLERKNKRRKIKAKKERSQVDQLLSISLREEELNKSVYGVESNLLQARASLQAAYMEVQRLLVLKQQVTMEMSALRTQRIEILQGLQESYDGPRPELMAKFEATALPSPFQDTSLHVTGQPSPAILSPFPHLSALPASLCPPAARALPSSTPPTRIKQDPDALGSQAGTPLTAASSDLQPRNSSLYTTALESPLTSTPVQGTKPSLSVSPGFAGAVSLAGLEEGFGQVGCDSQESVSLSSEARRTNRRETCSPSQSQSSHSMKVQDNPITRSSFLGPERPSIWAQNQLLSGQTALEEETKQGAEVQTESTMAVPENKAGKRLKKLKKKKALRKANDGQENSDTEQDGDSSRPVRKSKPRKATKGGKVSTSTPQKGDRPSEGTEPSKAGLEQGSADSDTSLEMIELPTTQLEVVAIDSSDSGDEKRGSPSKRDLPTVSTCNHTEDQKLGCDEVSSTSELVTSSKSSTNVVKTKSTKGLKNSSEVSSEPGEEDEPTEGSFEGHEAAVNSMQIHNGLLYTCSGDKTVRVFDLITRKCVVVFEGHTTKVNCLLVTQSAGIPGRLYTGSSDHTIRCYSLKTTECIEQFCQLDRVLCLHSRWKILFAGLANGSVVSFSLKMNKQLDVLECHNSRAVSCLATAQEGARRILLVGSYDCTISVRDAKSGLLLRTLEGHTKTVLCMKVVNDLVFSGSSDQSVHAHNIHTGELVRIYKGHSHAVTVVNILGKVMVTACLDKMVRVYELQSHDRLQVYGGHKDMVMCMTIHKSMIYTGCYDGSVQAVRLNLMQNYRCWWHGCSLIFGVADHLKHHLLTDHTNANFQTLKCRWRNCDAFFTARNGSKQDTPKHMQKHAEEDSKLDP
ncbi:zinc finger protein 106-like [Acipenser ruthenus]|uniref:zinc finger protein 106-like n=1 Tax=Acipenser ruthenus TaxID=7906 RepID=UPI002741C7CC|nr:zinc finger protein 106-like [Acipenser ruthenus]